MNKQIIRGLAAADLKLEEAGLLPKVEQEKLPEEITDSDGNLLNDCADVSPPSNFHEAASCLHGIQRYRAWSTSS